MIDLFRYGNIFVKAEDGGIEVYLYGPLGRDVMLIASTAFGSYDGNSKKGDEKTLSAAAIFVESIKSIINLHLKERGYDTTKLPDRRVVVDKFSFTGEDQSLKLKDLYKRVFGKDIEKIKKKRGKSNGSAEVEIAEMDLMLNISKDDDINYALGAHLMLEKSWSAPQQESNTNENPNKAPYSPSQNPPNQENK